MHLLLKLNYFYLAGLLSNIVFLVLLTELKKFLRCQLDGHALTLLCLHTLLQYALQNSHFLRLLDIARHEDDEEVEEEVGFDLGH